LRSFAALNPVAQSQVQILKPQTATDGHRWNTQGKKSSENKFPEKHL
jgi:hypothetical protein